jgi:putative endonuclease
VTARQRLGDFGERVAAHHLEAAGFEIVARKVRVPGGEIDLVARDGEDTVFVEVRTRRASAGAAAESLIPAKLRRMWACAMAYCEAGSADPECVRLDLVTVELDGAGRLERVAHFRGLEAPE